MKPLLAGLFQDSTEDEMNRHVECVFHITLSENDIAFMTYDQFDKCWRGIGDAVREISLSRNRQALAQQTEEAEKP